MQLSEQIRPWDTLTCCWDVKQPTNQPTNNHLSCGLADRWGTTVDFTTNFLHSSRFLAFRHMMFHWRPVHSLMLSSHRFLCLPVRLPPYTVPCRMVLASPDDRVTCPYHFSLRLFTKVRSSYGSMGFPVLVFTSSLVMWSLCEIPRSLWKHLISNACILLSTSAVMVLVSHAYKNVHMARERISLMLEVMAMLPWSQESTITILCTFAAPTSRLTPICTWIQMSWESNKHEELRRSYLVLFSSPILCKAWKENTAGMGHSERAIVARWLLTVPATC